MTRIAYTSKPNLDPVDPNRGTGRTTRQMVGAPLNSVYIWNSAYCKAAHDIALRAGREDLTILPYTWLDQAGRAREVNKYITVDHAVRLTALQQAAVDDVNSRHRTMAAAPAPAQRRAKIIK